MYNIQQAEMVLQMKLRGNSRGKVQEGQEGLTGSSRNRSDGSCDSQAGEVGPCEQWPKATQQMLKRWDVEDDADDEVRTTVPSQIHAKSALSAGEPFFLWAQYLYSSFPFMSACEVWGEGAGKRWSMRYYGWLQLNFQILARRTRFTNILWLGKTNKADSSVCQQYNCNICYFIRIRLYFGTLAVGYSSLITADRDLF